MCGFGKKNIVERKKSPTAIPKLEGFPSEEELLRAERETSPLVLALSVSAHCNLKCKYCYTDAGEKLPGELNFENHKKIIDEFAALNKNKKYIVIAMMGEPFLDKSFYNAKGTKIKDPVTGNDFESQFPIIDYANKYNIKVVFFTNTTIMDPEIASKLKNKDVSIIGKLNTLNPSLQEEMTGNRGSFIEENWVNYEYKDEKEIKKIKVPKGLKILMDAGLNKADEKGSTRLGVDIILTKENYKDIPAVVEFCLKNGIHPVLDTMIPLGTAAKKYPELKLELEEDKWLYKKLVELMGPEFTKEEFTGRPCSTFRAGIAYDNFGNVKMCCGGETENLGNVKNDSLKKIYPKIVEHKEMFLKNLKENGVIGGALKPDMFPECPVAANFRKKLENHNETY